MTRIQDRIRITRKKNKRTSEQEGIRRSIQGERSNSYATSSQVWSSESSHRSAEEQEDAQGLYKSNELAHEYESAYDKLFRAYVKRKGREQFQKDEILKGFKVMKDKRRLPWVISRKLELKNFETGRATWQVRTRTSSESLLWKEHFGETQNLQMKEHCKAMRDFCTETNIFIKKRRYWLQRKGFKLWRSYFGFCNPISRQRYVLWKW